MACIMLGFTIRELLLLTLAAVIAVAWWVDHSRLVRRRTAGMDAPEPSKPQKRRWSWRQYSISTLMIVITLVGVVLALVVIPAERQRRAVAAIHKLGGAVWYNFELEGGMTWTAAGDWSDLPGPDWLCRILGVDYFADAVHVEAQDMTDAGLGHLQGLTSLQALGLPQVTDADLVHLERLTSLEELGLGTQVTDAGLVHLEGLTGLRSLTLYGTQVTDAGLVHLTGLKSLKYLDLRGTEVTDAGLAHLAGLTSLQVLKLDGTQVTDAGLVHLGGFTSLEELYIGRTLTSEGFDKLRQALPNCSIVR
jgi:hypothetical protein